MKRTTISSLAVFSLALGGCGPVELILTAEIDVLNPETGTTVTRSVEDVELQLLPFDRDQVFASLSADAASSEPVLPPDLQVARDSIAQAQQQWRESESRWLALRERLEQISGELEQYNPAEAQYRVLFNEFNDIESEYLASESRKDEAFARFDRLQQETFSELEEFRALLFAWEEQAFAPFGEVAGALLLASGREILVDTTDALGRADFEAVPGEWWIYGRYPLATEELYWNIPIILERGDPVELPLSRSNAKVRDIL